MNDSLCSPNWPTPPPPSFCDRFLLLSLSRSLISDRYAFYISQLNQATTTTPTHSICEVIWLRVHVTRWNEKLGICIHACTSVGGQLLEQGRRRHTHVHADRQTDRQTDREGAGFKMLARDSMLKNRVQYWYDFGFFKDTYSNTWILLQVLARWEVVIWILPFISRY